MHSKPDNWNELTPEEKRTMRLEAWAKSADDIQFESNEAEKKYKERLNLFKDAVAIIIIEGLAGYVCYAFCDFYSFLGDSVA